jgi:hypothetical protein
VTRSLTLAVAACLVGASCAGAVEWRSVQPASAASSVTISVDSTELTYHRFDDRTPLVFGVEGPTRIKILTRVSIPNDRDESDYTVTVLLDGVEEGRRELRSHVTERAFYVALDASRPGVIRRIYIDVPTGPHTCELLAGQSTRVDARVFRSAAPRATNVSIAPERYGSAETLLSGDKALTYYVLTDREPVVLAVNGPTTVRVNTRLLYDETMSRDQSYVLGVREDDGAEALYRIETGPSETVTCRDRPDVIPGALRHFMLEVGEGPRVYRFRLVDTVARGLALKFYIPRGDLANAP